MQDPDCSMVSSQQGAPLFLITNQFAQNSHLHPLTRSAHKIMQQLFLEGYMYYGKRKYFLAGGEEQEANILI